MRTLQIAAITGLMLGATLQQATADTRKDLSRELGDALRNLYDEMQPALDDAFEMLKGFESLGGLDDPRHYQMPEVMENGDIIIRRRDDAPTYRAPDLDTPPPQNDTIDL